MRLFLKSLLVFTICFMMVPSWAFEGKLPAAKEARARALFSELRCVVCQNQSIDSSDADVAKDLREIVREQIQAGKTNKQIRGFLVSRYGQFILLKPDFGWHTILLWGAPLMLFIVGGVLMFRVGRRPKQKPEKQLSKDEEAELTAVLQDSSNG
ncbi:MAG: cytochrome c-type biogenesis protein [Rhizobiaceae bacterium]